MFRPEVESIGTERKLDPRIARLAVGATLVALGVIALARPTIDFAALVGIDFEPVYTCNQLDFGVADDCSGEVSREGTYQSSITFKGCNTWKGWDCPGVPDDQFPCKRSQFVKGCTLTGIKLIRR